MPENIGHPSLLCSLAEGHASEGGGEGLGVHLAPGPLDVVVLPARVLGALKTAIIIIHVFPI